MQIDRDLVAKLADLSRLELSEDELEATVEDLRAILGYLESLEQVDVEGLPPTAHPMDRELVMRPDEPRPSVDRPRVLEDAPDVQGGSFRVPRVL
jgi:aspartyl-tRNA(Asn)/glutamyl-tRNA(Gln) amidotransferase subunit C